MKRTLVLISFCCVFLLLNTPIYADHHETVETEVSTEEEKPNTRRWLTAGGGCVGGAILGSFLPIIGNALGCVAGGVAGFFVPTMMAEDNDELQPEALALPRTKT